MKLGDPCAFSADEVPLDSVGDIDAGIAAAVKASQAAIEKALEARLRFDKATKVYEPILKAWVPTATHTAAEKAAFALATDQVEVAEA